ncbi:hypothetical protein BDQ17DRAFT_1380452 [Cyathus striatus]|nr:hypothetical protein BDQ17DRAFT_1380452 [Cyathus striatus]
MLKQPPRLCIFLVLAWYPHPPHPALPPLLRYPTRHLQVRLPHSSQPRLLPSSGTYPIRDLHVRPNGLFEALLNVHVASPAYP